MPGLALTFLFLPLVSARRCMEPNRMIKTRHHADASSAYQSIGTHSCHEDTAVGCINYRACVDGGVIRRDSASSFEPLALQSRA